MPAPTVLTVPTAADVKPLRTFLFTNTFSDDEIERSTTYGSDAVILDLEDACVPFPEERRRECRARVRMYFDGLDGTQKTAFFARVRGVQTGYLMTDVADIISPHLTGILLPKVTGPESVHGADAILSGLEVQAGLPMGTLTIIPLLETAQAVRLAYEVATASPRVRYMGGMNSEFGDHFQALGYKWTPESTESLYLLEKVLCDVRAAGMAYPISGMWMGSGSDTDGVRRFAQQLRNMGYRGMFVGPNPDYVGVVNDVFTPQPDEIAYWQQLVDLVDQAEQADAAQQDGINFGSPDDALGTVVHASIWESAKLALTWARDLGVVD